MKAIYVLTAFTLVATGCGEDNNSDGMIDAKYQGEWQSATLGFGKTNPVAEGCRTQDETISRKRQLTINRSTLKSNYTYWAGSKDCAGKDTITLEPEIALVSLDKNDDRQIFAYVSYTYLVTLNTDGAAAYFNAKAICDRTDWQAKRYDHRGEQLKSCTNDNGGEILFSLPTMEEFANYRLRLKTQGNGISYSVKTASESDEEYDKVPLFFAR